jgi:hypothetical protein
MAPAQPSASPTHTLAFLFPPDSNGRCDFDGDAVNDTFWAAGVTWCYHSSLVGHNVYLNLSSDGILGAYSLSDVDGDGRCDVTTDQGTFRTPSDAPFTSYDRRTRQAWPGIRSTCSCRGWVRAP